MAELNERKPMSKKLRFDVFKRDGFACQYCGAHPPETVLEVDHVVPVSGGGSNDMDNLITACLPCNRGKGAVSLELIPRSLADKAQEVAELEAQIEGYQDILRARKERVEADCWEVAFVYMEHFSLDGIKKADLQSIKLFVERLGVVGALESMERAVAMKPYSQSSAFKYFCGICWNKIKGRLMARARNIKPGFFTNDKLGELEPLARLLFAGLWTLCDREGRVEDRPKKIKAELLPYDNCDGEALLLELERAGFISRYEKHGKRVIQVLEFAKHQNPHVKEAPSSLPAQDEPGASPVQAPDKPDAKTERAGLIPSSLIPESSVAKATDAANASAPKSEKSPEDQAKAEIWLAAVAVLKAGGCDSEPLARSFMGKLVKDYGLEPVRSAVASAATAQPADAREYLKATCQRLKGERKDPVTVLDSPMRDVAKAELARQAAHSAVAAPEEVRERLAKAKAALTLAGVASTIKDAA